MIRDYPVIRLFIYFSTGIVLQSILQVETDILFIIEILLIVLCAIFVIVKAAGNNLLVLNNIMLVALIMGAGALHTAVEIEQSVSYPYEKGKLANSVIYGNVTEIDLLKKDYFTFKVESDYVITNEYSGTQDAVYYCKLKRTSTKIHQLFQSLQVGNGVRIEGVIRKGRERRNPYEFDYNAYLNSRGIAALVYIKNLNDIKIIDTASSFAAGVINVIRNSIAERIDELYNTEATGLIRGLLLADKSGIDYTTREYFVNAGVIHVLAVSGLHVGFIAYIFFVIFNRFNIYIRYIATIAGLFIFVAITGAPASVFRASIMASILLITQLSNRSYNNFNTLALAGLILLVIDPHELLNPGFQLSFSAVFSILYFYPIFRDYICRYERIPAIIQKLLLFFAVSLSAQIGTLPFTLTYFHKLSIIALLTNLLVIPMIAFIVSVAIASLFFSTISIWFGSVFAAANETAVSLLYQFVDYTGGLEYSFLFVPMFSVYDGLVFYFCLFGLFYTVKLSFSKRVKMIIYTLICTCFIIYVQLDNQDLLKSNTLNILMIDIGQGDSIFIRFPNGRRALIDGGNSTPGFDNGMRVIYPLLRNLGIDRIDYGIVTHMDADHYKGMVSLIEAGIIDTIYKPILDKDHERDVEFEAMLDSLEVPYFYHTEAVINIGRVSVYSLTDTSSSIYRSFDVNNKSGIYKIVYGNTSFLFVGDAEKEAELLLAVSYKQFLKSDVLKLGHHGSRTSTTDELLHYVDPELALISAGPYNKFNHPSPETIEKLMLNDIEILRTDLRGAILLQSDGREISIVDWR